MEDVNKSSGASLMFPLTEYFGPMIDMPSNSRIVAMFLELRFVPFFVTPIACPSDRFCQVILGDVLCHEKSQIWRLQKVEGEEAPQCAVPAADPPVSFKETRSETPGTDTVVVSHDGNTTTTTRITTTVTTVTTVCKSSCLCTSEQSHQSERK